MRQRAKTRFLASLAIALGGLAVLPAASQAIVAVPTGIAVAGTVQGYWSLPNGPTESVTVQLAGVENCSGSDTFVAHWTDPTGAHVFRLDPTTSSTSCSDYDNGAPQQLNFDGTGTLDGVVPGTLSEGTLQGPNEDASGAVHDPYYTPNSVIFVLRLSVGTTVTVGFTPTGAPDPQTPGPLQGAPGRVQPFGPIAAAT